MFYNQDYLQSKKVGLHIIWLASTLGNANVSAFRKLSKRDIAGVDVPKSCQAVANPEQPLALRTSSLLMYGVVRVYTKQTDFWMNDVRAAYTAIRRLILQSSSSAVTTLGGIVIVGNDTSTIDLPPRERGESNTVTLFAHNDLHRYNLHLDSDWLEIDAADGEVVPSTADSLSMFGSSLYRAGSEVARQDSLDLQMYATRPSVLEQPFTADPNTIRRDTDPIIPQQFDNFDLEQLDLPQLPGDEVQLDLNLDDVNLTTDDPRIPGAADDQTGFDLNGLDDEQRPDDRHVAPEPEDARPAKRARNAIEDNVIGLSTAHIRAQVQEYAAHMINLRDQDLVRRIGKQAQQQVSSFIFGPTVDFAHASDLAEFWTTALDAKLLRASPDQVAGQGQADGAEPVPDMTMQFDDGDYPAWQGPDGDEAQGPRASTPEWGTEIGRAGPSDPLELPWNRAMDNVGGGIDDTVTAETTLGVSARSFSIETPTGLRRPGRQSSMSGRASVDLPFANGMAQTARNEEDANNDPDNSGQLNDSQMFVEQDVVNFMTYARTVQARQGDEQPLFFSDLAPVADTNPGVAARAFHHILSLTTAGQLSVEQMHPYGEIGIRFI